MKIGNIVLVTIIIALTMISCSSEVNKTPPTPTYPIMIDYAEDFGIYPVQCGLDMPEVIRAEDSFDIVFTTLIASTTSISRRGTTPIGVHDTKTWMEFTWAGIDSDISLHSLPHEIPVSVVLVSGSLVWEGDATGCNEIKLSGTVKLPWEGLWRISTHFNGGGYVTPDAEVKIIALVDGASVDVSQGIPPDSPLAYLRSRPCSEIFYTTSLPGIVTTELELSQTPVAGEEFVVNCRVLSDRDISDLFCFIDILTLDEEPSFSVLESVVIGNVPLDLKVKADTPEVFSLAVTFPGEGQWLIITGGSPGLGIDCIKVMINADGSYYEKL